jgi:bifunctional NMN adenylyltransferase/nudix hydrolase
MDYATREKMLRDAYPDLTMLPIMDQASDQVWSNSVDSTIRTVFPIGSVCIYGGRDSFLPYYTGVLDTSEFPPTDYRPGTDIREEVGNYVPQTPNGRRGIIYSTQNQFRRAFVCIDCVITNGEMGIVAGSRPSEEGKIRLPGGFLDPGESLEAAVRREVMEEVGCAISDPWYITSRNTFDWRFKKGQDGLTTALFGAKYLHGPIQGADDLPNVFWVDLRQDNQIERFIPGHQELVRAFLDTERRA